MSALQDVLDRSVAENTVPFVVAMTANSDGVTFSGAAGEAAPGRMAAEDTAFRIFSMTKAIGSLAAMILIDRGKLDMDTPVADILPEWNDLQVIDGFDGDTPVMRPQKTTCTLRNLATHTAGIEYEFWNPDTPRVLQATGQPGALSGLRAGLNYPLTSDPGTRWGYGLALDWLGMVVEAVDGRRIDAFCREEILDPLGMTDTQFEPGLLADRLAAVKIRSNGGDFAPFAMAPPPSPEVYGMGHALYSTAPDYLRFLRMVLNKGALDGERILSEAAATRMLENQMPDGLTLQPMQSLSPVLSADVVMPADTTHSFAFVRHESDIPNKRRAGSQSWAGVCNTHYWLDPASDVAAVLMTQTLPFVEAPFLGMYDAFERAVYAD